MRAIVIALAIVTAGSALNAAAGTRVKDEARQCRYKGAGGWSDADVKATIKCAEHRWSVPGGSRKAIAVARCESGLNEHNTTSASSAKGVYQFIDGTWRAVRSHYRAIGRRFSLSWRVFNARANVLMAIRYAHAGGWSPWTCAH